MESDLHMLLVLACEELSGDVQARSTETVSEVHVIPRNECTEVRTSFVRQCLASIRVSVSVCHCSTTALLIPALTSLFGPASPLWLHCLPWHCLGISACLWGENALNFEFFN